tara:strand:- start:543 stop:2117 length:1575 start_codon:yes stop_codon:yes gene_type:complete
MNKKFINNKIIYKTLLIIFSFYINYYYANLGVFPIDTFAFFDTAYNILNDRHPFRDIWVTTGPFVDYLQSIFFKIFGLKWQSYVIHSSFLNSLITLCFFKTLIDLDFNKFLSFIYALGFGALCYTVSGTPFAYLHSYSFSLLSLLIFFYCVHFKSKKSYFLLPFAMCISFLSMQNPSTFINVLIIFFLVIIFFKNENRTSLFFFLAGSLTVLTLLFLYFYIVKIPFESFFIQYFLFPLTMGEYRLSGNDMAHISLSGRLTFRNVLGHFKFLNLFLLILIFVTIKDFFKNKISSKYLINNLSIFFVGILLIFNQLLTSNQTYIFSLIPFVAAFLHNYLDKRDKKNKKFTLFLTLLMIFCVLKYHFTYNEQRKFMDLQNVNLNKAVSGSYIDPKLKGLKWITPKYPNDPSKEISFLKETIEIIKKDNRAKLVMTDYQFLSILTEKNLNISNRWYTHDNNSYPLDNHKYFYFYKDHINKIIDDEKISVVYTVGDPDFSDFKIYFNNLCYNSVRVNDLTTINTLVDCK